MAHNTIFAASTRDAITVWWDKPAQPPAAYTVLLNGHQAAQTDKTHCVLSGLAPSSVYDIAVCDGDNVLYRTTACTLTPRRLLNVTDFGAVGDGKTLNTAAIQAAIDACEDSDELHFPEGVYKTGALNLHSRMLLHIPEGAVLSGTDNPEDYLPRIPSRFEGTEMLCYRSLLNLGTLDHASGPNAGDVLIYGGGVIESGGQTLCLRIIESETERLREYLAQNADYIATCENEHTIPGRVRPRLINLSNCQNVRISGMTLKNGASWNVHMIYSRDIITDHCTFISEGVWNGDGWDPDSSENCTLFASRFFTGDDAVAVKSGKNPEGNAINRPTRHIRVFDCESAIGHGISIGSEISGGIEDVRIWDCDLVNSNYGVQIKGTKKRGAYVRGVTVTDCALPRVMMHAVPYNDDGVGAEHPPVFENCRFERLRITGRALEARDTFADVPPVQLIGFDVPGYAIRNVRIADCTVTSKTPMRIELCTNLTMENMSFTP